MRRETATKIGWWTAFIAFLCNPVVGICMGAMNLLTDNQSKKWEQAHSYDPKTSEIIEGTYRQ